MEPQEKGYQIKEPTYRCEKNRNCWGIVSTILLTVLAIVIGIIIGATLSANIIGALSAIIVLAIVLGLLLILSTIQLMCNKTIKKKQKYYC